MEEVEPRGRVQLHDVGSAIGLILWHGGTGEKAAAPHGSRLHFCAEGMAWLQAGDGADGGSTRQWANDLLRYSLWQDACTGQLSVWDKEVDFTLGLRQFAGTPECVPVLLRSDAGDFQGEVYLFKVPVQIDSYSFFAGVFWTVPWPLHFMLALGTRSTTVGGRDMPASKCLRSSKTSASRRGARTSELPRSPRRRFARETASRPQQTS